MLILLLALIGILGGLAFLAAQLLAYREHRRTRAVIREHRMSILRLTNSREE